MTASLLLVDDEPQVTQALKRALRSEGYRIRIADSGSEALAQIQDERPDLVITDQRMPGMTGSEFLIELRKDHPDLVAIMLSGYSDFDDMVTAINEGSIYQFLSKPWDQLHLRKVVKEALARSREAAEAASLKTLQTDGLDATVTLDRFGYVTRTNALAERLLGYGSGQLTGVNVAHLWSPRINADSLAAITHLLHQAGEWQGDLWLAKTSGDDLSVEIKMKAIYQDGQAIGHVLFFRDQAEQTMLRDEVEHLRTVDSLTGLLNDDAFMVQFHQRLGRLHEPFHSLPVAQACISKYEELVVSLGYPMARSILQEVGIRLLTLQKSEDWLVARVSEDRFAIVGNWTTNATEVEAFGARIAGLFSSAFESAEHCIALQAHVGLSVYPNDAGFAEALLQQAHKAALRSADLSEENWQAFHQTLGRQFGSRFLFERALLHAIEHREMMLFYQPQIDLESGRIESLEALVRWRHPEHGMISPAVFIPYAEQAGLIEKLDQWVLQESLNQLALWKAQGIDIRLSLNVSPLELQSDEVLERFRTQLARYRIPPGQVEVEITETSEMNPSPRMVERLRRLREMGVSVILDDFGTGYSSLTQLCYLPIDGIKIDRSFLYQAEQSRQKMAIIESVITLATQLGLKLVAEGVDSETQLDLLRRPGLRSYAQSFMLGVPMSAAGIAVLLGEPPLALEE